MEEIKNGFQFFYKMYDGDKRQITYKVWCSLSLQYVFTPSGAWLKYIMMFALEEALSLEGICTLSFYASFIL